VLHGAHIVRVHDVKAMKAAVEVADAVRQAADRDQEQPVTQTRWQRGQ
jgi:dihydropteroate synthase